MFKLAREVMGTRPLTVSCGSCSHRFDIQFGRVLDGEAAQCPACGEDAGPIVIAEYDQHCLPHAVLADGTELGH
jgi:hypothetical protein